MSATKKELCGILVSQEVFDESISTWPKRPPTGYDDRLWRAACANHVLLIAREHGEEPDLAAR
jgi:hypothetical protein